MNIICSSGGIGRRVGLKIQSGFSLGASSSLAWSIFKKTYSNVGLFLYIIKLMEKITIYEDFNEFYSLGCDLAEFVKLQKENFSKDVQVEYARNFFNEFIRKSYFNIGIITDDVKKLLQSDRKEVRFSIDNLIKNKIRHPEIKKQDYNLIPIILSNPDKVIPKNRDVLLFKKNENYYRLVIKTTENKQENYIKSFHKIKQDEFEKLMKKR